MLTNLFVGIPCLLTMGFLPRAFSVIVITDGWCSIVVTVHTGAVFAEAGGGVPCSQLLSSYSLLFKPQTRSSSGTQEMAHSCCSAPILCLSITVPLRCLGSRAMLTVSGPGHNIVISDNSPETTSHLLPQLHSHYIYNSSRTRHTLSVILNRSGP